ncbi:27671_t:CDS:2 [Gigaspora margarita]|uniref:27671_t:CDS:1 n=1 Tax=Gigaspora margarita TaxID=4874 RepID=A0ABN7W4M3_GIGMA|nr:27671_t:CDS:2 [Gigaspora margarita]
MITKENSNSLTQGLAKYQLAKNDFSIVCWKYFYPFQQPYTEFLLEFETTEIPLSVPHCLFTVLVSHDPKEYSNSTYFDTGYYQYNSHTNSKNGIISNFTMLEITNIDFMTTSANTIQNMQGSTSLSNTNHCADIDIMAEDTEFTASQSLKRSHRVTTRSSKQYTGSSFASSTTIESATSLSN